MTSSRLFERRSLLGTGGALLALRLAFVGAEFLAGVLLARTLGAEQFGVYAFVIAVVALLAGPATLGLDRLLVREVSRFASKGSDAEITRAYSATSRLVIVSGACAFIFGASVCYAWLPLRDLAAPMAVGLGFMTLQVQGKLRQSVLQALNQPLRAFAPEMLVQPTLFLGSILTLHAAFDGPRTGLESLAICGGSVLVANLVGRFWLASSMRLDGEATSAPLLQWSWLRKGMPFLAIIAANTILTNIDSVIVGLINGPTEAGFYRVASQMAMFIAFPSAIASALIAPRIAARYAENDLDGLRGEARTAGLAVTALSGSIFLALIALGPWILKFYGAGFGASYPSLVVLSVAYLLNAIAGIAGYVLVMTRYEALAARAFWIAALGIAVGCVVLIPPFGMLGAATATAAGVIFLSAAFAWLSLKLLDFGPFGLRFKGMT